MTEARMQVTKEIVSVSEMARMVGLSRARFYQLVHEGIFPPPNRNPDLKRPVYDREQQEQCVQVRRTNRGLNGKVVLFYALRPSTPMQAVSMPRTRQVRAPTRQTPAQATIGPTITELRHGLAQLGAPQVTDAVLRQVLTEQYPDGHEGVDRGELLRSVLGRINRRNSEDNVAG